ncbi:hypothetical protein [Brevundimonas sp.]|uniref:hypothetical protein n=1 Tax=Brevundimonas sp. TaxID=1871086 RepID=UPI0035ADECBA
MVAIKILTAASALLSLTGGVTLGLAFTRFIRAYERSFDALEMTVHALARGDAAPVFTSTDGDRLKAARANRWLTSAGVACLILSAMLGLAVTFGVWTR